MKKAVVVLSGGMDSTTALHRCIADGYTLYTITFDYGQRHSVEINFAESNSLNTPEVKAHKLVNLGEITELINNSALTGDIAVPEGHYAADNMKLTVVPNRNMIMYSIAAGYALNIGAEAIYVGVHAGDHFIYPDCRKEFIQLLEKTIQSGTETKLKVVAPFINGGKEEIVKIGTELGVDYKNTWSCYKGGRRHCGVCGTCVERKEAFELAGVQDPTEYLDDRLSTEIGNK